MWCRKPNVFFNWPTSNFKGQIIAVFRNHTTFFIYICYCGRIIPSQEHMNTWFVFTKWLEAKKSCKQLKWIYVRNSFIPPPHLPPMSVSHLFLPILLNLHLNRYCLYFNSRKELLMFSFHHFSSVLAYVEMNAFSSKSPHALLKDSTLEFSKYL